MERITNAVTNTTWACLLFFILFSACSKNTQVTNYEKEKSYAQASWEIEQGHTTRLVANPVRSINITEENPFHVREENSTSVTEQKNHKAKQEKKEYKAKAKEYTYKESMPSYSQDTEQQNTAPDASTNFLKWAKMLAFLPLAVGVALMQRKMNKTRKTQDTLIIGGLISILIVILLIVLILALI